MVIALLALFSVFIPFVGVYAPDAGGVCSTCAPRMNIEVSLSCYLLGVSPKTWLGTYYSEGTLGMGCEPVFPGGV